MPFQHGPLVPRDICAPPWKAPSSAKHTPSPAATAEEGLLFVTGAESSLPLRGPLALYQGPPGPGQLGMVGREGGFQEEKVKLLPKFSSAPRLPVPTATRRAPCAGLDCPVWNGLWLGLRRGPVGRCALGPPSVGLRRGRGTEGGAEEEKAAPSGERRGREPEVRCQPREGPRESRDRRKAGTGQSENKFLRLPSRDSHSGQLPLGPRISHSRLKKARPRPAAATDPRPGPTPQVRTDHAPRPVR